MGKGGCQAEYRGKNQAFAGTQDMVKIVNAHGAVHTMHVRELYKLQHGHNRV